MNTRYITSRLLFYCILLAMLATSCTASQPAITDLARIHEDGTVELIGGATLDRITPEAIAINGVLMAQRGAFALINEGKHLAVFLTPGGQAPGGQTWYFSAIINTNRVALVDARRQLQELGIDSVRIQYLSQMVEALKKNGFTEMTGATTPVLIATLKLGIGFLRSIGGTISETLIMPAYLLTPEQLELCEGQIYLER